MKIIADDYVDMDFGTGAVKITPAHDHNDFKMGKRHNLEEINILTENGAINDIGGKLFAGVMRFDAREKVKEELEKKGLFRGIVPHSMRLGRCLKTKDIIEPFLKP